jgi:SAM-dependent methyltransferase
MKGLADKINKLSIIKQKFADLGEKHDLDSLTSEKEIVQHYSKMFRSTDDFNQLIELNNELVKVINEYQQVSKRVSSYVNKVLHKKEINILQEDYRRYLNDQITVEDIQQRDQNVSAEFTNFVKSTINQLSDWRYPGCIINPVNSSLTMEMLACEPLYIISDIQELITDVRKGFNSFYNQNRLRVYNDIIHLPLNTLGLAICINQLEYMPLDAQADLLGKIYNHLQPGGRLLISYNDCDNRTCLEHTLEGIRSYSTKQLTLGKAFSIGFDIKKSSSTNNGMWNYAILSKPGQLHSIKTAVPIVKNV